MTPLLPAVHLLRAPELQLQLLPCQPALAASPCSRREALRISHTQHVNMAFVIACSICFTILTSEDGPQGPLLEVSRCLELEQH